MEHTIVRETWLSRRLDSLPVTVAAMATMTLFFGSLFYWRDSWSAQLWMPASFAAVFGQHEWWRAWSTLLVHENLRHVLSNSLLFFIVGIFLNGYFGLLVFPLAAFFFGGVTNLIVLQTMPETVQLIGASGIVFWMGGCWLALYFFLDRRKSLPQRALRALGVALVLFMPAEAFDPSISYKAHGVGFILGVVFGLLLYLWQSAKFHAAEVIEIELEYDAERETGTI